MTKSEKTVYEIGYNILPIVAEEDVAKEVSVIKDKIISLGGEIISDGYPSSIKLAYEMIKEIDNKNVRFNSAYFGWIKFEIEPSKIEEIKKFGDSNQNFLRYMIIKTVKENTLYSAKVIKPVKKQSSSDMLSEVVSPEKALPMDEVEVDKKIDELISEEPIL